MAIECSDLRQRYILRLVDRLREGLPISTAGLDEQEEARELLASESIEIPAETWGDLALHHRRIAKSA